MPTTDPPAAPGKQPPDSPAAQGSLVAQILGHAAELLELRYYPNFTAGPDTWMAVHGAVNDLVTGPTVEALRRHLRVKQVQHWDTDRADAVAQIRAAAAAARGVPLSDYQISDAAHRIEAARVQLCRAFDLPTGTDTTLGQLAEEIAHRLAMLTTQRDQLLRDQDRQPNRSNTVAPSADPRRDPRFTVTVSVPARDARLLLGALSAGAIGYCQTHATAMPTRAQDLRTGRYRMLGVRDAIAAAVHHASPAPRYTDSDSDPVAG